MSKVIGIDLGTTNSAVAVMEGGTPQIIPNHQGGRVTPSVVAFTNKGETLVGQIAKRQALTNPENTVQGVKRLVGQRFDSPAVKAATRFCPYQIVEAANGDAYIRIDDAAYSPPEIEAMILRELKAAAEDYLGDVVDEAIISVPAYFNDRQRNATKDAGTIAGLKVPRILNEATAASLAYGMSGNDTGKIAIYDLGGGTLDVSILELKDGIYQVLATAGDTYLGGEDFDELIIEWLVEEFQNEHGIDVTSDHMALQRLKEAAEKVKCELSYQSQAEILLPFLSTDQSGPKHLRTVLSRTRFEQMLQPMLEHTAKLCREALREAGLKATDIDDVVPVGGADPDPGRPGGDSRDLREEAGPVREPRRSRCHRRCHSVRHPSGRSVRPRAPRRDAPHPRNRDERRHVHPTHRTQQRHSRQGKPHFHHGRGQSEGRGSPRASGGGAPGHENTSLTRFRLEGLPRVPATEPEIEVILEIDVDGILQVTAKDRESGRRQVLTVRSPSGLSREEMLSARRRVEQRSPPKTS